MMAAVPRAVMALAVCCLGDHRREWALAMRVEFEAAIEDEKPLIFAIGCLIGAWRDMPAHEEGRFVLANHALAIGLVIPVAALSFLVVLLGFPHLYPGPDEVHGLLAGAGKQGSFVTDGNRAAMPTLAVIMLSLGVGHLRIAWVMLERDWARVAVLGNLIAAITTTLVIFTAVLFLHDTRALVQAAVLVIELTAISALARWHDRLPRSASSNAPAT